MADGPTAAEAAGAKALGAAALTDRATDPAAVLGPGDRALSQKPLKPPAAAAPAACPLTEDQFRDKLMGMLLLGAYGDAFGGAREVDGLDGKIAADPTRTDLRPFSEYVGRSAPQPFGVWSIPANPSEKGVVTDDTCVRLMLLHQWLRFHAVPGPGTPALSAYLAPSEGSYELWLKSMLPSIVTPPYTAFATVLETRDKVIADILCWLDNAKRHKAAPAGFVATPCTTQFWVLGVPVVFGQFLYLELASIYGCCDRTKVLERFRDFSVLDQQYAAFASGLLAAVLSQAIGVVGGTGFADFFTRQVEDLLARPDAPAKLARAWPEGKKVGIDNIGKPLNDVLAAARSQLWDPRKPKSSIGGLGKFDPELFLAQMAVAVQYGASKPKETLAVLALGVGDADTIPAQLGSIMGAYFGETALRAAGLGPELDHVKTHVETYLAACDRPGAVPKALRLTDVVDTLQAMAARHGCCRFP